jgi:type I restriction enzyme S subunit
MTDELPDGWASARIAEVFEVNPRKPAADHVREGTPVSFVPMGAVDAYRGAITEAEERPFGAVRKGYTAFADGDVLLAKITPCFENGKAAVASSLLNGLGFGSSEFHIFRPQGSVLAPYLFHFLRQPQLRAAAAEFMTGTAGQARVPIDYLRDLELPIAPLAEQRRIVAKVEALLDQVRRAKDRLDRVPLILKRFRQTVLTAASSGRLTESWRDQRTALSTGADVIRAARQEATTRSGDESTSGEAEIPATWAWASLGEITVNHDGRRVPVKSSDREKRKGPYPYYGASGVIDSIDGHLFDGEFLLIAEDGANLLSRSTPIAFAASGKFWVNNHAHIVQARAGIPLDYLRVFLNGIDLQDFVTGTAQPKLTQKALNGIPVPVPPLDEQVEIVRRVDDLFSLATSIEQRVARAAARAGSLPQAILSRAFAGELVPTEADLARDEVRNYETAEQLLERVQLEARENTTAPQGRRRAARA